MEQWKQEKLRAFQHQAKEKHRRRTMEFGTLFRSKGFLWNASSHDFVGYFSHAGDTVTIESPGTWKALHPKAYTGPYNERMAFQTQHGFVKPYGDRRQELVFIGIQLDHEQIRAALDECLLTDEEMNMGIDGWKATIGDMFLGPGGSQTAADS